MKQRKPTKYRFVDIAKRITGFSTPFGGISWSPPESERKLVRDLLTFLEDRRVLYNPRHLEIEYEVRHSILEIRAKLTNALANLDETSKASAPIRAMRSSCRRYLDSTTTTRWSDSGPDFFLPLGELRAEMGAQIAVLSAQYELDLEGDISTILPSHVTEPEALYRNNADSDDADNDR